MLKPIITLITCFLISFSLFGQEIIKDHDFWEELDSKLFLKPDYEVPNGTLLKDASNFGLGAQILTVSSGAMLLSDTDGYYMISTDYGSTWESLLQYIKDFDLGQLFTNGEFFYSFDEDTAQYYFSRDGKNWEKGIGSMSIMEHRNEGVPRFIYTYKINNKIYASPAYESNLYELRGINQLPSDFWDSSEKKGYYYNYSIDYEERAIDINTGTWKDISYFGISRPVVINSCANDYYLLLEGTALYTNDFIEATPFRHLQPAYGTYILCQRDIIKYGVYNNYFQKAVYRQKELANHIMIRHLSEEKWIDTGLDMGVNEDAVYYNPDSKRYYALQVLTNEENFSTKLFQSRDKYECNCKTPTFLEGSERIKHIDELKASNSKEEISQQEVVTEDTSSEDEPSYNFDEISEEEQCPIIHFYHPNNLISPDLSIDVFDGERLLFQLRKGQRVSTLKCNLNTMNLFAKITSANTNLLGKKTLFPERGSKHYIKLTIVPGVNEPVMTIVTPQKGLKQFTSKKFKNNIQQLRIK